jgi:hypothetical protein
MTTKAGPDINDTLRSEGTEGVRRRHDKARRYNGKAEESEAVTLADFHAYSSQSAGTPFDPTPSATPRKAAIDRQQGDRRACRALQNSRKPPCPSDRPT